MLFSPIFLLSLLTCLLAGLLVWSEIRRYREARAHVLARADLATTGTTLMRIRQAVESASDAIGIGDMEANSLYHNRAHMALFGYTVAELNTVEEPAALFADKTVARQIHENVRQGISWQGETEIKTKTGKIIPAMVRADIIRDDHGAPIGIFGVFTDITARRAAERTLAEERDRSARAQRLESLGLLAGGIAHDFNNLLQVIVSGVGLMRATSSHELLLKQTQMIENAAWRAQELTRNLTAFARGAAPIKKPVAIGPIIKIAATGAVNNTPVTLELGIAGDLIMIEADPVQIDQVMTNLFVNAVQAMPDGGQLRITADNVTDWASRISRHKLGGAAIRITVSDTGAGIPRTILPRIWEPFFTTKDKGTGLGLATTHTVVKKHGGVIEVDSEPGHGTTFTLILPASEKVPRHPERASPIAVV